MRFGTRLTLFLAVVLISVQALTVAAGHFVSREQLIERRMGELKKAGEVFTGKLDLLLRPIADNVLVLAHDRALRRAIAEQDMETAASKLLNRSAWLGVSRMLLVDPDGRTILDTGAVNAGPEKFAFPGMLDSASPQGSASGMAVIGGKLNFLAAAPVGAPMTTAYLVAVVPIDDALIDRVRHLYTLPLFIKIRSGSGATLAASEVPGLVESGVLRSASNLQMVPGSKPAVAVFEFPVAYAYAHPILWPLLVVSLVGLCVTIAGAAWIARKTSKPIEALAASARRIEGGDYTPPTAIKGASEIAGLSQALGAMARSIDARQTELQKSNDDAWRASRAKSEFLANMSHEIRTPLNAVLGLAGVLIDTPLSEEQRRQVALIKESGTGLLSLLNDLLDLSKLDAGQVQLEASAFDAVALTRESVELMRVRAAEKGIALNFESSGEIPAAVSGDPARVRQVLINLVGNAIKFTEAGGVFVRVTTLSTGDGKPTLRWSVADTGIGIPPERVGLLFQDFVQADSSISRRFGGTGLGLAICRRLVERMGGTIDVTSTPGQGSTFTFQVPLDAAAAPLSAPVTGKPAPDLAAFVATLGREIRILVAEDNPTNQFVARSILNMKGVRVDLADNGFEAIASVSRHDYDLVFMDLQMPEMDGLTATRKIRARGGRFAALPIVAFSANAYASDIEACAEAGMNGHIAKPVQKETLQGAVVDVLSGRIAHSAAPAQGDAKAEAPDFDRSAVDALIEGLTSEVVGELLASFVQDTRVKLQRLPELLDNCERLAVEVHALKSAGAQVGAMRLSQLSAELERRARQREAITGGDLKMLSSALERYNARLGEVVKTGAA